MATCFSANGSPRPPGMAGVADHDQGRMARKGFPMSMLRKFFSTVEGSVKGVIDPEELYRSILTSLGSGSIVGLMILMLQSVLAHVATIFPNPNTSTLATMFLTLLLDLLRRQSHGDAPAKTPDATTPGSA
jgi:hypothetical protein